MQACFDNLLQVLADDLPSDLIDTKAFSAIRSIAKELPPIYRGGLECRLVRGDNRVDLHQCILADEKEIRLLIKHIAGSAWARHPAWEKTLCFCRQWSLRSSLVGQAVANIWLEFDVVNPQQPYGVPALFIQLNTANEMLSKHQMEDAVEIILNLLYGKTVSRRLFANLRRCSDACCKGAGITHLGIMLSRNVDYVRVNVSGLTPKFINDYLIRIGWPGSLTFMETIFLRFLSSIDQVVLCLDVGTRILPNIGLEYVLYEKNSANSGKSVLTRLVDENICTYEKQQALLAWPGHTRPVTAYQTWPAHLIAESIMGPPDRFSLFSREINHIKLVGDEKQRLAAKAYLWFAHVWAETAVFQKKQTGVRKK
jgi:hypothetical protein